MKLITSKPFSLTEIANRFDKLAPHFIQTFEKEVIDKEYYSIKEDGSYVIPDDDDLTIKQKKILDTKPVLDPQGRQYGWKTWMERVFYTSPSLNPRPGSSMYPTDFLHTKFRWCRQIRFDEHCENSGKFKFLAKNVIKYWLSSHLGFFNFNGNVVQVNPAELYAIQFLKAQGNKIEFDQIIGEVRMIPIPDDATMFPYNQFEYYIRSINGDHPFESDLLRERGLLKDLSNHYLMKDYQNLKYLMEKRVTRDVLISNLRPLGTVVDFGYDYKIDRRMSNRLDPDDIHKQPIGYWQDRYFNEYNDREFGVYTGGCFASVEKYEFTIDESECNLSSHLIELGNYLRKIMNRKDSSQDVHTFREQLASHRIYEQVTTKGRKFITDIVTQEARQIGYLVEVQQGRSIRSEAGDTKRIRIVKVSKLKRSSK